MFEEVGPALPGPPKLLGMERMRETAPTVVVEGIIAGAQEAKTEILAYGCEIRVRNAGLRNEARTKRIMVALYSKSGVISDTTG